MREIEKPGKADASNICRLPSGLGRATRRTYQRIRNESQETADSCDECPRGCRAFRSRSLSRRARETFSCRKPVVRRSRRRRVHTLARVDISTEIVRFFFFPQLRTLFARRIIRPLPKLVFFFCDFTTWKSKNCHKNPR